MDMLVLILIIWNTRVSKQMEHIPETRSVDICKGNDVDLLWKVDEEENKISKLEWYFNNRTICTSSAADAFTVNTHYQGRIERIGKTGIRMKNVSLDDEGIFILFPLLAWSTSQNMKKLSLRVLEPPANKCTCKINYMTNPSRITCELATSICGRPHIFAVWKRKDTLEVLGEGNDIMFNSSFQDKEIICCLEGTAMKCVDDPRRFCTSVSIPNRNDETPHEGGNNTQPTDSVTMPVPQHRDNGSNNMHCLQSYVVGIISAVCSMATTILCIILILTWKNRQSNIDIVDEKEKRIEILAMKEINPITAKQRDAMHGMEEVIFENKSDINSKTVTSRNGIRLPFTQCLRQDTEGAIAEHQPSTDSKTMIEIQELRNTTFCKICFTNEMSMAFMPCSHITTCASCSIALQHCPVCNTSIERKINISFAIIS